MPTEIRTTTVSVVTTVVTVTTETTATKPRTHSFAGSVRRTGDVLVDIDECSRPMAARFPGDVHSCRRPEADPIHKI